ncbi:TIR domain-containing protein [Methanimicrococcus sp. OttesenSCG-928-J09]|nr:TIR domain-containing protein [Methanimicrococcus sp. OttesenSCG-928-J09]
MTSKALICFDSEDFQRVKDISALSDSDYSENIVPPESFQNINADDKSTDELASLLNETDITIVFIGKHTFENEKCLKAIEESFKNNNAFLAVYFNNAEDVKKSGKEILGKNPFDLFYFEHKDSKTTLNQGAVVMPGKLKRRLSSKEIIAKTDFIKTYDYIKDNGAENLKNWIEEERQRKADFWTECAKISEKEWPAALKVTNKGGIVSMFLYYDFINNSQNQN